MFSAEKRIKLSTNNKQNDSAAANSLDHGIESDFGSSLSDFSLPQVKRKRLVSRQVSFSSQNKRSFDIAELQQTSSGYGSLLSSSSTLSPHKSLSRTPKKRKTEESDENAFYNSYQFVSPLKIRKKDPSDPNGAKLILKEKSSSENVILSSTPISKNNKNKLWGKFRSLHQEKFEFGRSLEDEKFTILPRCTEASFGSSFDLTSSFNLSEHTDIPSSNLQQLWSGSINLDSIVKPRPPSNVSQTVTESTTNVSTASITSRTRFYCGRLKMDVLGKLHAENNLAVNKILSHLSDIDLLSLSHVSKDYRSMIKSNKTHEPKRQNYLKAYQKTKENQLPGATPPPKLPTDKARKGKFGDVINHSMQLRSKHPSPPVSPSRRKFHENQKVKNEKKFKIWRNLKSYFQIAKSHAGPLKKCPRCCKPAIINSIKIRSSPRKKKSSIHKLSTVGAGRVHKRIKTFLSKPSIESQNISEQLYTTFPCMLDSASDSSNCGTPSSDESSCETEIYEFAECSGISCNFKFCVNCNCKYHPRQRCKELSPPSPSRSSINKSSVACSNQSFKSLKRLVYWFFFYFSLLVFKIFAGFLTFTIYFSFLQLQFVNFFVDNYCKFWFFKLNLKQNHEQILDNFFFQENVESLKSWKL